MPRMTRWLSADEFSTKGQNGAFSPHNAGTRSWPMDTGYFAIPSATTRGTAERCVSISNAVLPLILDPDGMEATRRRLVLDRTEELLRILALESVRNQSW